MNIPANNIHQFARGTRRKLYKILGKHVPVPYMRYREIDLIRELLLTRKPMNCLEFGCGYSSLYFTKYLPENARWMAIEHNKTWSERIQKENTRDNLHLYHVEPDNPDYHKEGNYEDFKAYLDFPVNHAPFDFILVDGMARNDCMKMYFNYLKDDGVLIIHDNNRSFYHDALKTFPYTLVMEDYRRSAGGMGFGMKQNSIHQLFNHPKHRRIWWIATFLTNVFKFKYLMGKPSKRFQMYDLHDRN